MDEDEFIGHSHSGEADYVYDVHVVIQWRTVSVLRLLFHV